MEGHRSGTRPHTLATTTTVKAMVAPPDGSPLRITQRATAGLRDGSLRHTAVGWTTAKVMVGRQSGGQEDFEDGPSRDFAQEKLKCRSILGVLIISFRKYSFFGVNQ
jgi:hypothetical protein